jgi:nitrate reductase gamma subunit
LVGFLLEGMRIAMTGWPQGSEYAFVGHWLAGFLRDPDGLVGVYGYVWYAHAVLTGAFVAYIPFSRLMHVVVSPIVLAMRGAERH